MNFPIKIDLDMLLSETQQLFEMIKECHKLRLELGTMDWHNGKRRKIIHLDWHPEAKPAFDMREKQEQKIRAMCEVIGANEYRVYGLTRLYLKWEEACNWQYCFPTQDFYFRFLSFIFPGNEEIAEAARRESLEHEVRLRVMREWRKSA